MSSGREQYAILMLNNGNVLVCGGGSFAVNTSATDTCDLYDPSTNSFTFVGNMHSKRGCPAYGLLNDGRVFLGGGSNSSIHGVLAAEIFDPTDNSFTIVSDLPYGMYCPTTFVLPNGLVLVAGGVDNDLNYILTSFLYNVTNDTYTSAGRMLYPKFMAASVWLPSGMLAVTGFGIDIYNPTNNTWFQPQNQPSSYELGLSAFLLSNGKVVLFGGWYGGDAFKNITIWDPIADNYTTIGYLHADTSFNAAVLLPNDIVVLAGGLPNNTGSELFATNIAEIWQLDTPGSQLIAPMSTDRAYATGIAIGSNKMLVVGGTDNTEVALKTAEVVTISTTITTGAQVTSSKVTSSTSSTKGTSGSSSTSSGTSNQTTGSHTSSTPHLQICFSLLFTITLFLM